MHTELGWCLFSWVWCSEPVSLLYIVCTSVSQNETPYHPLLITPREENLSFTNKKMSLDWGHPVLAWWLRLLEKILWPQAWEKPQGLVPGSTSLAGFVCKDLWEFAVRKTNKQKQTQTIKQKRIPQNPEAHCCTQVAFPSSKYSQFRPLFTAAFISMIRL